MANQNQFQFHHHAVYVLSVFYLTKFKLFKQQLELFKNYTSTSAVPPGRAVGVDAAVGVVMMGRSAKK